MGRIMSAGLYKRLNHKSHRFGFQRETCRFPANPASPEPTALQSSLLTDHDDVQGVVESDSYVYLTLKYCLLIRLMRAVYRNLAALQGEAASLICDGARSTCSSLRRFEGPGPYLHQRILQT